ncbi:MAG TPA: selenocysteine-specific translation elongation factor [Stellaceae bacterium]|nr:selenocysteine-specific translation elongation factor [Stellaceae bacterium]
MILATAGHIDHGKTALVRALTGVDADRLPEEKRRGLTIDLGFAYASLPDGTELGFVDVPGHERFLPNMLAGVLSIDRVLLVVAADDGPRPQTLEHLDILELIGVAEITGVVSKIDRAGPERVAAIAAELRALLAAAGHPESPIFALSSRTGEGVPGLAAHLREMALAAAESRAAAKPSGLFRLPIDRAFSLPGIGLVVTGTVAAGALAPGERLVVSPGGQEVRVRGLHAGNRPVERANAGERAAVNIVGSFPEGREPKRGDWLLDPARHLPTGRLDLRLAVSRLAEAPLRDGVPAHLHLGTEDVVGRVAVLGVRALSPGESGFVQLDLDRPIGALAGDRAVLRDHAQRQTLGGGRVVDPFAPRRGRRQPARLAVLAALAEADHRRALARLLEAEGTVDLNRFALSRNLAPAEIQALAADFLCVGPARERFAASEAYLAELAERLAAALAEWHEREPDELGPSRPVLFRRLAAAGPEAALEAALFRLAQQGRAVRQGALWRLAEHRPRLSEADERLWQRVLPLIEQAGLRPPRVRELAEALGLQPEATLRFLARAERFGRLSQVADNRFFLPDTLIELARVAAELAAASPDGSFAAASYKDRSGVGRNLTIEILEYFDRMGLTRRSGDVRVVLRDGGEVFG